MAKKPPKHELARQLWLKGKPDTDIARALDCHRNTVSKWRKKYNWEALKDAVETVEPEPVRPKVVPFKDRQHPANRPVERPVIGDLSTTEGQLAAIDELIEIAFKEAQTPLYPQTYASSMAAIPKLLAERRAIAPLDRVDLLLLLMSKYRDPQQMIEDMKAQGWGRKAS